ncbi:diablo-like protein [Huso huso]|uniref:Direct IAP-binding protein with low pI n=1 Tax=Huso huso TaxID=61971 RepID=A0ABR0ZLX0_HUSHU|nr:diablo homolog, mitochondrial-like isoform X1 [Acipenser ruthenus]
MAALRRGVFGFRSFRLSSFLLNSSRQKVVSRDRVPFLFRCNYSKLALGVGTGLCAVPFSKKSEDLTHEALIKRAVSLVTNSANTYLSQTTLALVDTLTEYTKALYTLISIQKRYVGLIGKMNPNEEDAIWQLVIRSRVEVNEKQEDCKRFESNWMNAVNLSERAAEAAYVAGADQASVFARSHLQMSQTQVEEARQLSLKAERMLAEVQADEIRRTAQQAQTSESAAGLEEEIPDAYLRED